MPNKKLRFLEFLIIGVVMGITEDLLAIAIATDAKIDFNVFIVVVAVALPFAFLSEYIVDHPKFWQIFLPSYRDKIIQNQNKNR